MVNSILSKLRITLALKVLLSLCLLALISSDVHNSESIGLKIEEANGAGEGGRGQSASLQKNIILLIHKAHKMHKKKKQRAKATRANSVSVTFYPPLHLTLLHATLTLSINTDISSTIQLHITFRIKKGEGYFTRTHTHTYNCYTRYILLTQYIYICVLSRFMAKYHVSTELIARIH